MKTDKDNEEGQQEAFDERAAIIQFCSGREMSREEAERIAAKQLAIGHRDLRQLMIYYNPSAEDLAKKFS